MLTGVGLGISLSTPGHDEPYEAIYQGLIFVTAAAAGQLSRAGHTALRAQTSRADRAEAELELGAARERMAIARELHDVVAHHVSLIAVQAEAAASSLPGRPAVARTSVDIISETARTALTELRRILGILRASAAGTDGPARSHTSPPRSLTDLGTLLDQVRGAGLAVDLTVTGDPFPVAPGVGLTAYRVVQEALTNTIKHSAATTAEVALDYAPGYVALRVSDSPNGATRVLREPTGPGSGFGLAGLAERVASCGGSLSVGPDPAGGFTVSAKLPSS
ncbi:MAG: histidine kinase [Streptosporangiaceae bacterium]